MKNKIDVFELCKIISLLPNPISYTNSKCAVCVVGKDSEYYLNFVQNHGRWELILDSKTILKTETRLTNSVMFIDECTEILPEQMKNITHKSKVNEIIFRNW